MSKRQVEIVLHHLHRLTAGSATGPEHDRQLLERFVVHREEAAFAALLDRHGAMVLRVCRRILHDAHEAEDAFQATFLILARQAHTIRQHQSIASWLYKVAYHVAVRARARATRRQELATRAPRPQAVDPLAEVSGRELLSVLDDELQRLPEKYRAPLLLCYLEGHTQDEAARQLGWSPQVLRGRIERGRAVLRRRLVRRGFGLSAVAAGALLEQAPAAVPALLTAQTVRTVMGSFHAPAMAVSLHIATLAEAGMQSLAATKLKLVVSVVLMLGVLATGLGTGLSSLRAPEPQSPSNAPAVEPPAAQAKSEPRRDRYGDPLPPGVLARLGTVRLRHGVFRFAFSPDGKRIASAGTDGFVRIWSTETGKEERRLDGHRGAAYAVAYSPDGKWIATGDVYDIHLWDAATGKKVRKMAGFDGGKDFKTRQDISVLICALAFSPDGKVLAASEGNVRVSLWDVPSGELRGRLEACGKDAIAFLPDGQRLLAVSPGVVRLCDLKGKEHHKIETGIGTEYRSTPLALAPDGKSFVVGGAREITENNGMVQIVIGETGVVSLWDLATGKERRRLEVPQAVLAAALSPDGKTLAYDQNQTIHLLDVASWKEVGRIPIAEGDAYKLAFSPDGKALAASCRNGLQFWNVATGHPLLPFDSHLAAVDTIAFTANGKQLVSTCQETGVARLWDTTSGRQLHTFAGDWAHGVVAPSRDGERIASSGQFNSMSIWNTATGRRVRHLQVENQPPNKWAHYIRALALSRDGRWLTSISSNNNERDRGLTILVQDAASGKERSRLKEPLFDPRKGTEFRTLSPDGQVMVQSDDRTICLRDVSTGRLLRLLLPEKLQPNEALSRTVVFSADGRLLACVSPIRKSEDGRVKESRIHIWELATAKEITCWAAPDTDVAAFSPDGRILATANRGRSEIPVREAAIPLWDAIGGEEIGRLQGHGTFVASLAFSPDGQRLATGLTDSTVLIWGLTPHLQRVRRKLLPVRPGDLPRLWADLAGEDARKAQASLWALASAPPLALPFLEERLASAHPVDPERVHRWIEDLDSEQFAVRQSAAEQLRKLDQVAEPALRKALERKPSLESRRRIEELLDECAGPATTNERRQVIRAVAVLEHMRDKGAQQFLKKLANGVAEARLTREAKAAFDRLER